MLLDGNVVGNVLVNGNVVEMQRKMENFVETERFGSQLLFF